MRHRELCSAAGISPLTVISDRCGHLQKMVWIPEAAWIPSPPPTIPQSMIEPLSASHQIAQATTDSIMSDPEAPNVLPPDQGKRPDISQGNNQKRELQESPSRLTPSAKRLRVEVHDTPAEGNFELYEFDENTRIEPGALPEVRNAVRF